VDRVLARGAAKARQLAGETIVEVKRRMGFLPAGN